MRSFTVMASNANATYTAGDFCAETAAEACELARESYARSNANRELKDVGSFRFFTVSERPRYWDHNYEAGA